MGRTIGSGRGFSRHIASFLFQSLGPFPLEKANQPNNNQTNKRQCGLCTIVATHAQLPAVLYLFMNFLLLVPVQSSEKETHGANVLLDTDLSTMVVCGGACEVYYMQ